LLQCVCCRRTSRSAGQVSRAAASRTSSAAAADRGLARLHVEAVQLLQQYSQRSCFCVWRLSWV
jgi:hypothetical protein